ncbi:MAG: sialidase family protein [Actinomycetota bacterium]
MLKRALVFGIGLALLGSQAVDASPGRLATVTPNVNITRLGGNQSEAAIAIDPTDPNHVVEFSNREHGVGMVLANSVDGGVTWETSFFARDDRFGRACCDPTLSWDAYGNLFMAWLDLEDAGAIPVAISTDGGQTFEPLKVLRPGPPKGREEVGIMDGRHDDEEDEGEKPEGGEKEREPSPKGSSVDQPTIVAGEGAVWLTWNNDGIMQAAGAPVTGLGQVGKFSKRQDIAKSRNCSFGDIAIGPLGQVFEVCTKDKKGTNPKVATIRAATDPDGLGPLGFTVAKAIGTTNVQQFDAIPPQRSRTVDAETGLAWDTNETSAHLGRLYLVWTDEQPNESDDTDVWLRSSDDTGVTWSAPVRVNDVTTNAQFMPRIALDPTTGNLAIGWHDARNDLGDGGTGDTDGKVNTDAMYYVTFSTDGGATFAPAVAASAGVSNAKAAQNGIDFGDYSGLAFFGGIAMPAWSDNSNSTGDNPGGALKTFDIYTARVGLV